MEIDKMKGAKSNSLLTNYARSLIRFFAANVGLGLSLEGRALRVILYTTASSMRTLLNVEFVTLTTLFVTLSARETLFTK